MFLFPGLLVFVKDDRVWLQFTGTVHPHPALRSCRTSIFAYLYHGFIRMHHMMLRKFLLHPVIYTAQVPLCSHDRPAAQGLCREKYIAAFKLFGKPLNRLRVYILQIINTGNQGRGSQTVPEQIRWTLCARKISPIRTYIYLHVMFNHFKACRMEFQTFIYFVRKLFVAAIRKCDKQFLFRQGMGNHSHRNTFDLFLTSSCFLFSTFVWFREDILQFRFRECRIQIYGYLCLIESEAELAAPVFPAGHPFSEERPKRC